MKAMSSGTARATSQKRGMRWGLIKSYRISKYYWLTVVPHRVSIMLNDREFPGQGNGKAMAVGQKPPSTGRFAAKGIQETRYFERGGHA